MNGEADGAPLAPGAIANTRMTAATKTAGHTTRAVTKSALIASITIRISLAIGEPRPLIVGSSRPAHRLPDDASDATCWIRSRRTSNPPEEADDEILQSSLLGEGRESLQTTVCRADAAYRRRTPSRSRSTRAARGRALVDRYLRPSPEPASSLSGSVGPEKRYTPLARLGSPFASSPHWMKPLRCTTPETRSDALDVYAPEAAALAERIVRPDADEQRDEVDPAACRR